MSHGPREGDPGRGRARRGEPRPRRPAARVHTISGGVSLGSYEAGLVYYVVEGMRLNPAAATPRVVTGASAGSVNGFITILQSCGGDFPDPAASLLFRTWIPLGLEKLHVKGQAGKTSAFSRAAFEVPLDGIVRAWDAGLAESCDAVFGLSVTRLVPRFVTTEGEKLRLPRVEEHFQVRVQGRGAGKRPRLTNYVDPSWEGEQALLPEVDGEVVFERLVDALFASTAFPGAFPPQTVQHCVVHGTKNPTCPLDEAREDLFVDGGVFDNTPVGLASRLAAAGLRVDAGGTARWLDAPDLSKRDLPPSLVLAHVSTDAQTFPAPAQESRPTKLESIVGVALQVGGSFLSTARAKNLLYIHDDEPGVFEQLLIPERHLPAASAPLGAFFGFVEGELRRFDFALGMYDAHRLAEERFSKRLAKAGTGMTLNLPEDTAAARQAVASWAPYGCLHAVMEGAPGAEEACAGEELRDFRIVFQSATETLWDICSRIEKGNESWDDDPRCRRARLGEPVLAVPGVGPLAGDAWRRGEEEDDTAYAMRLLAAHGFAFKDLGLAREEAAKAPAALRARLLEIGDDVASTQPSRRERLVVSTLLKMGADSVAYVPPRFTVWAMYGRDPEIGISKGFQIQGVFVAPLRLHAAAQFIGIDQLFSSEGGAFVASLVAGAEYLPSWWSNTRFQPSLLLRGGWMFSSNDDLGFGTCDDPKNERIGHCSRPTIHAGVSGTLLDRVRVQLTGNWYPPARAGQDHQWAIGPGIGLQWAF